MPFDRNLKYLFQIQTLAIYGVDALPPIELHLSICRNLNMEQPRTLKPLHMTVPRHNANLISLDHNYKFFGDLLDITPHIDAQIIDKNGKNARNDMEMSILYIALPSKLP